VSCSSDDDDAEDEDEDDYNDEYFHEHDAQGCVYL
jgi:hypothetical protein